MAINCILAMTGAEIRANTALPPKIGWMACHFSPYGTGLCNLPTGLPEGTMLILNDRTPIHGHDPQRILGQLQEVVAEQRCSALLLDLQRPGESETARLAEAIVGALPCPVGVSEPYGAGLACPVFLPPVPLDMPLRDYLAPWQGREVWLEAALDGLEIRVTEKGALSSPGEGPSGDGLAEGPLHCHYQVKTEKDAVRFTLWRSREDLDALLAEAEGLGVKHAIGLWQELRE